MQKEPSAKPKSGRWTDYSKAGSRRSPWERGGQKTSLPLRGDAKHNRRVVALDQYNDGSKRKDGEKEGQALGAAVPQISCIKTQQASRGTSRTPKQANHTEGLEKKRFSSGDEQ